MAAKHENCRLSVQLSVHLTPLIGGQKNRVSCLYISRCRCRRLGHARQKDSDLLLVANLCK